MQIRAIMLAAAAWCQCSVSLAQGADACRPRCSSSVSSLAGIPDTPAKILGINYSGVSPSHIERLQRKDLLGVMKMSGIWVSKLSVDRYLAASARFCRYATERDQEAYLQIPLTFSSREISLALENLVAKGCKPKGFSIGNEVDRLVTDRIVSRYAIDDYVADYNRIVPLTAKYFPDAKIIALELSSFTVKDFKSTDPAAAKYRPIFDWLIPFSKARLAKKPDYLSVHYYPFTGGQKEWETLAGGRIFQGIVRDLEPYLRGLPPILIGEFNTTYQYENSAAYPGSGGDSFMIALTILDLFTANLVAGVFHWSLWDGPPSTLSLYQNKELLPAPLLHAYRMLSGVLDYRLAPTRSSKVGIDSYAFQRDGRYSVFLVNSSPFFRRNVSVSTKSNADIQVDFCDCKEPQAQLTLPPLSMTAIAGNFMERGSGPRVNRFLYADRVTRDGSTPSAESTKSYCAPLADFSLASYPDSHFENPIYNQNNKIGTGGTFIGVSSPGTRASLQKTSDFLNVDCALPRTGHAYYQCGVKFPVVTDALSDKKMGADWTDGYDKGTLRLTLSADVPLTLELHLEDFQPEALRFNTHQLTVDVSGIKSLDVPIRQFSQLPGRGFNSPLKSILQNLAALRIETRQAGFSGTFRIHKFEVCDAP